MASDRDSTSLVSSSEAFESFNCPECQTTVTRQHGSMVCSDCGFAPRHGAD